MADNRRVTLSGMSNITLVPFFVGEDRNFGPVGFAPQDNLHNPSQAPDDGTLLAMTGAGGHFQITALPDGRSWNIKALSVGPAALTVDVASAPFIPLAANRLTVNVSCTAPTDNRRIDPPAA